MKSQYKNYNGKILRYGYTTGSCASAAAKAAGWMLVSGEKIESIDMVTSKGVVLHLLIGDVEIGGNYASCSVIKDAGDDPDVTHGAKIFARVTRQNPDERTEKPPVDHFSVFERESPAVTIQIEGGVGVGRVTKPGLSVPVGLAAINPVPRRMIADNFFSLFDCINGADASSKALENHYFHIEISVPEGENLAKRTYNPHLGIVGGISIIGTTGIVEPMSEQAITDTIHLEIAQKVAQGVELLILSPGNYGRDFVEQSGLGEIPIVKTSNYIGESLTGCRLKGMKKVLLIGHLGKLCKVAGGIFNTHSSVADGRMEILSSTYLLYDFNEVVFKKIMGSNTTDEAVSHIKQHGDMNYFAFLSERISAKCRVKTYDEMEIGTILFSTETGLLGMCEKAKDLLREMGYE